MPNIAPLYDTTRSGVHEVFVAAAEALGCKIHLGHRVQKYEEMENGAAIITPDGTRYEADIVVAADGQLHHIIIVLRLCIRDTGFNSRAKKAVLGFEDLPRHSGYAVYRAYFDLNRLKGNPICGHLIKNDGKDSRTLYIGPDCHFIFSTLKGQKDANWSVDTDLHIRLS